MTLTYLITTASVTWLSYDTLLSLPLHIMLLVIIIATPLQSQWVGLPIADPWGILLSMDLCSKIWCIAVTLFTLLHAYCRPEMRRWSGAVLVASIGIALASDLFHMYVWLEVITFAFLGFASGKQVLKDYWALHIFAAILVLIGTVMIYRDSGTLTLPDALLGARESSLNLWLVGWLIKAGAVSTWLINGYTDIDSKDISYAGAVFTKVGLIGLLKVTILPIWVGYLGTFNIFWGVYLALTQTTSRMVLCSHIISQIGIILVALTVDKYLAMLYMVHHMLAKGLLLDCIEGSASHVRIFGILCLAGLSMNFFIKFKIAEALGFTGVAVLISSFLTMLSLHKYMFIEDGQTSLTSKVLCFSLLIWNVFLFFGIIIDEVYF